jgi:hypothetical protein
MQQRQNNCTLATAKYGPMGNYQIALLTARKFLRRCQVPHIRQISRDREDDTQGVYTQQMTRLVLG